MRGLVLKALYGTFFYERRGEREGEYLRWNAFC